MYIYDDCLAVLVVFGGRGYQRLAESIPCGLNKLSESQVGG